MRCAVFLLAQHPFDMSIQFGYSVCFSDTVFSVDTDAIDVMGDEAFTVRASVGGGQGASLSARTGRST